METKGERRQAKRDKAHSNRHIKPGYNMALMARENAIRKRAEGKKK